MIELFHKGGNQSPSDRVAHRQRELGINFDVGFCRRGCLEIGYPPERLLRVAVSCMILMCFLFITIRK